jgi:hypothetical protein
MRGGKREGSGRPRLDNKKVQIYFSVSLHLKNNQEMKKAIKDLILIYEENDNK